MWTHGSFHWNELITRDAARARRFYEESIGWRFEAMPMEQGTYWVAKGSDKPVGGVFELQRRQFDGPPEPWVPYLAVDDIDARC